MGDVIIQSTEFTIEKEQMKNELLHNLGKPMPLTTPHGEVVAKADDDTRTLFQLKPSESKTDTDRVTFIINRVTEKVRVIQKGSEIFKNTGTDSEISMNKARNEWKSHIANGWIRCT